jgi:hypothetical protein
MSATARRDKAKLGTWTFVVVGRQCYFRDAVQPLSRRPKKCQAGILNSALCFVRVFDMPDEIADDLDFSFRNFNAGELLKSAIGVPMTLPLAARRQNRMPRQVP